MYLQKKAFTLIELLIVVAIIGILAAIAVPNFLNAQTRAKIARIQSDARSTSTALEQYRLDNNAYPVNAMNFDMTGYTMLTTPVSYMTQFPVDVFKSQHNIGASDPGQGATNSLIGRFLDMATDTQSNNRTVGAYALASSGPDQNDDTFMGDFPWTTRFLEYAPSNGLNSDGDIIRLGGNFQQGNITANGKPLGG